MLNIGDKVKIKLLTWAHETQRDTDTRIGTIGMAGEISNIKEKTVMGPQYEVDLAGIRFWYLERELEVTEQAFHHDYDLKYGWFDCTCEVICPCGNGSNLILSSDCEDKTCDVCGRTYRLRSFVEVKESGEVSPT